MERSLLHWRSIGIAALLVVAGGSPSRLSAADDVGSLVVESDPAGAAVYVDGRLAGQTPLTLAAIAPGVHRVQLARAGYLENGRLITVKAGARAMVSTQLTAAAPPLKIVVVEGEGAVNIIQQKTAVAPVVEVRDRNDQPVSGAVVRFAIQKGRATFNGARMLTATTDALGRATATGLAPTGSGQLSIAASATFQGQTAAVAIAQTNVMTAAQAATVSAGTGGASAGGGGLSNLAIAGIVGGAGAGIGGALLASKASSDTSSDTSSGGSAPGTCGSSPVCGGWQVVFSPGLDVSACGVTVPGGLSSQTLNVDASGAGQGTWGNGQFLQATATLSPTGLAGTLRCVSTPATGTISATPSGGDYLGTATLSGTTVSIRVTKFQPQP